MINMNSKMKVTDRDSVCRLCLCHSGSFLDIFLVNDCFGQLVADAIAGLLQIEVTKTDIFPKVICVPCFKKIVEFEDFKKKCLQSKDTFSQEFVNSEKNEVCQETFGETTVVRDKLEELLDVHSYAKSSTSSGDAVVSSGIDSSHYLKQVSNRKDTELSGLNLNRAFVTTPQNTIISKERHQGTTRHKSTVEKKENTPSTITERRNARSHSAFQERLSAYGKRQCWKQMNVLQKLSDVKDYNEDDDFDEYDNEDESEEDRFSEFFSDAEQIEDCDAKKVEESDTSGELYESDLDVELDQTLVMRQIWDTLKNGSDGGKYDEYTLVCDRCGKVCKNKITFRNHLKVHTMSRRCGICEAVFKDKEEYRAHCIMHQKEKRYACETCGKSYNKKPSLVYHMNQHLGVKPYTCNICSRGFVSKTVLSCHMRIHRGEKPFTCKICGKMFRQNSNLTSHLTSHSDQRPYKCHLCNKTYKRKYLLRNHLLCHGDEQLYPCDECSKTFKTTYRRGKHKQTVHYKGKPVSCEVCYKTFSCLIYLRKHMATHKEKEKKKRIRRKKNQFVEVPN